MAELDGSIYFRNQGSGPDIMGSIQEGMKMGDMLSQRRKQQAIDQAYKAGVVQNPDGTTTVDNNRTMSALAGVDSRAAMEFKEKSQAMDANQMDLQRKKQAHGIDMISRVAPTIKDQASYEAGLTFLRNNNVDVNTMPQAYDPGLVQRYAAMALSAKEKMEYQYRDKEIESKMLDRKEARDERRFQSGLKMDEKMQGLKTPYGLANTEDDAKKLKEAHEAKKNFDNKLGQMIALRKKHNGGAILNRDDVGVGQQLSKDLLLEYKNMAKLGVLSQSDEAIINAIIPKDPLEYNSPLAAIQGQDPVRSKLETFQKNADEDFQTRVGTRTREGLNKALRNPSGSEKSAGVKTFKTNEIDWAD